jgi:hypothetical protein
MIKIEIDEKEYYLPSNWNEVSLDCLMKLNNIKEKTFTSDIEQSIAIIESISDMTEEVVLDLPINDLRTISDLFEWVAVLPNDIATKNFIMIDDVKYVPVNIQTISSGEFISLEVFQKGDVNNNLHLIAAILIRPEVDGKVEKLKDIFDIQKRAELFKEKLMVGDYWPIVQSFFYGAATSSLTNTQDSSGQPKSLSRLKIVSS